MGWWITTAMRCLCILPAICYLLFPSGTVEAALLERFEEEPHMRSYVSLDLWSVGFFQRGARNPMALHTLPFSAFLSTPSFFFSLFYTSCQTCSSFNLTAISKQMKALLGLSIRS
jgi:hypothetical protein